MNDVLVNPTTFSIYAADNLAIWKILESRPIKHSVWGECIVERIELRECIENSSIFVSGHKVALSFFRNELFEGLYLPDTLANEILNQVKARGLAKEPEEIGIVQSSKLAQRYEADVYNRVQDNRAARIQAFCQSRNIRDLVHFTHIANLSNILAFGLLSRAQLNKILLPSQRLYNDESRLDRETNAICTSISFPNYKMFYALSHANQSEWAVLAINANVLWELDCAFCKTNAASESVTSIPLSERRRAEALEEMFADNPETSRASRFLPEEYPTDPQAEVLVFDSISRRYFRSVNFFGQESAKNWILSNYQPNLPFQVAPAYFQGRRDWQYWA